MRYHKHLRIIHWMMAIVILSLLAMGIYMSDLEGQDEFRSTLYFLHKSFGVLILMLLVARIILRRKHGAPVLPAGIKQQERLLASIGHYSLYALMFLVPMAGIWMSNSWGHGVSFFGLFDLPFRFPENKDIGPLASETHEYLAFGLLGVVVLHVLGALKHRFIDKNDVIYRMTWGRAPEDKNP